MGAKSELKKRAILVPFIIVILLALLTGSLFFQKEQKTYGFQEKENVYEKYNHHTPIRYLVIGDSIGRGSGAEHASQRWFKLLEKKMYEERHIDMKGDYIVQSGSTAFEGLYKLNSHSAVAKPDLIFIVFGENDRKYMNSDEFGKIYESLIRKAKKDYPTAEIITLTESCLAYEDFARQIALVSKHYQAVNIDMRPVFKDTGLPAEKLTRDLVHPNSRGYRLYADSIYQVIKWNAAKHKKIAVLSSSIHKNPDLLFSTKKKILNKKGFIKNGAYYISGKKGDFLEYSFTGNVLGVNLQRSPDGGEIKVFIDGKPVTIMSTWWPFQRKRPLYITTQLSNGHHTARFETTGSKTANHKTKNSIIRISSIITNKN
ncbi:SGNH/GDSL hydrolase family protein [Bacillus sp. OV322]|uniref:SGNH/GDSL hydrolase family protein n=1 Tax=Bacillus sp. OV322 TaxID=1882764 RepID=UPI000B812E75|nr:SGNH/GDSL hydrolase family protein [Bacillus sp. OV322]